MTDLSPKEAAEQARQELGVALNGPLPDILDLVEQGAGLPVTVLDLPAGISGAFGRHPDRSFIFINSCHYPVRRRFTLAHEYGHYRLGHAGTVDPNSNIDRPRVKVEKDANAFAAAFLLPVQAIDAWVERNRIEPTQINLEAVVILAVYHHVSARVALYGLERARFLGDTKVKEFDQQITPPNRLHLELQRHLGLTESPDSLSFDAIQKGSLRFPRKMTAFAVDGVQRGLVSVDSAALALHRTPEQIRQAMTATPSAVEEGDAQRSPIYQPTVVAWP